MEVFKQPRSVALRGRQPHSVVGGAIISPRGTVTLSPEKSMDWSYFEKRRHHMNPPNLFDEGLRKFANYGDLSVNSAREAASRSASAGSKEKPGLTRGVSFQSEAVPGDTGPALPLPEDLGLRKAHFYDNCLRADRAVEMPRLPAVGGSPKGSPPNSARERRPSEFPSLRDSGMMQLMPPRYPSHPSTAATVSSDQDAPVPSFSESMGRLVSSCRDARMNPSTTGIIRTATDKLKLEYGCITDTRAEAMLHTLRASSTDVREACFRSNGLTERGAKHLISALPECVHTIDLSQNELGCQNSTDRWNDGWCNGLRRLTQLRSLNVSDSQLGDTVCKELCKTLMGCRALTALNLSGNNIYTAGSAVGSLVRCHKALRDLDMHWNHCSGESARDLARDLHENAQGGAGLQNINLSWNPLGKACGEETCKYMAQLFAERSTLLHIDISKCELPFALCQILADGIKTNTSLLGIHVGGNEARMDPHGFLVPERPSTSAASAAPGVDSGGGPDAASEPAHEMHGDKSSCCWICEKWRETRVSYIPGVSGPDAERVWVFTSMDGFGQATRMTRRGAEFVAYFMAPSGTLRYIFQAGTEVVPSRTAHLLHKRLRIRRMLLPGETTSAEEEGAERQAPFVEVSSQCYRVVKEREADEPICQAFVPRHAGEIRDDLPPSSWEVGLSLFAPYEEALARRTFCEKCFEVDWRLSNIVHIVKDDADRGHVKEILKNHYAEIKVLFSSLCSSPWHLTHQDSCDQPLSFGIGLNEYTHMVLQHNLMGDDLPLADVDALYMVAATPSREAPTWHRVAQTGGHILLRHSFFELLVRLAMRCFVKGSSRSGERGSRSKAKPVGTALKYLFDKHIMYPYGPMRNNFKCVQWRVDVLHTEVVEAVYRKHTASVLDPLFKAFARHGASGHRYLSPEDWFDLLDKLDVLPYRTGDEQQQLVNTWDRVWLWQISAMSRVDELMTSEHLEFVFVEVLEAIGRLVGLLRSRKKVAEATPEEAEKWDYGLGCVSASLIFCVDKEGVMDKEAFAGHLDKFLGGPACKHAIQQRMQQPKLHFAM